MRKHYNLRRRRIVVSAAAFLVMLAAIAALPPASSHGEGGPEIRQGTLTIRPAFTGGTGYNETQFSLANGDAIQYSWSVKDPQGHRVDFNVHGHVGAEVRIFNRTDGSNGAGSIVASAQMIVALMWQSANIVPVNVSYAIELRHAPDLYSSAFLTANLAGLMLLFTAVWELSIRGRKKVDEAARSDEDGRKSGRIEKKSAASGSVAPAPPPLPSSRRGFFSSWKRRAALYAIVFLVCSAPLISYMSRPGDVIGTELQPAPWAAFVAHEGSPNLTIVDPIFSKTLGDVRVRGPVVALASSQITRLVYAATSNPPGVEYIDGATFAVMKRIELPTRPYEDGLAISSDGRTLIVLHMGNMTLLDSANGTERGKVWTGIPHILGVRGSPEQVAIWDSWQARLVVYDLDTLKVASSLDTGNWNVPAMLSPTFDRLMSPEIVDRNWTVGTWDVPARTKLWQGAPGEWALGWKSDGSAAYTTGPGPAILARDPTDGHVKAQVNYSPNGWVSLTSSKTGILYVADWSGTNATMVRESDMTVLATFDAGDPANTSREFILDSTGSFALITAAGSGELITFHDAPGLHYHSRMNVGVGASHCVLLEPPENR